MANGDLALGESREKCDGEEFETFGSFISDTSRRVLVKERYIFPSPSLLNTSKYAQVLQFYSTTGFNLLDHLTTLERGLDSFLDLTRARPAFANKANRPSGKIVM